MGELGEIQLAQTATKMIYEMYRTDKIKLVGKFKAARFGEIHNSVFKGRRSHYYYYYYYHNSVNHEIDKIHIQIQN